MNSNNNHKAFTEHRTNGIFLEFPNGNTISSIWGCGSYTEHHDDSFSEYDKKNDGSDNVEIMIHTSNDRLRNKIFKRMKTDVENGVIGWISIMDWLWILNQLVNDKIGYRENVSE